MIRPLLTATVLSCAATGTLADSAYRDLRDGEQYPVIEIAGMSWFGRNLNHALDGSFCFGNRSEGCAGRGRLYRWELAVVACPAGWHLSTEQEWRRLEAHLGVKPEELELLKSRGVAVGAGDKLKVGGDSGLDIVFAGWRNPEGEYQEGNGNDLAAALWTSAEAGTGTAWHRDVSSARPGIWRSEVDKPYSLSVRCVRDDAPAIADSAAARP